MIHTSYFTFMKCILSVILVSWYSDFVYDTLRQYNSVTDYLEMPSDVPGALKLLNTAVDPRFCTTAGTNYSCTHRRRLIVGDRPTNTTNKLDALFAAVLGLCFVPVRNHQLGNFKANVTILCRVKGSSTHLWLGTPSQRQQESQGQQQGQQQALPTNPMAAPVSPQQRRRCRAYDVRGDWHFTSRPRSTGLSGALRRADHSAASRAGRCGNLDVRRTQDVPQEGQGAGKDKDTSMLCPSYLLINIRSVCKQSCYSSTSTWHILVASCPDSRPQFTVMPFAAYITQYCCTAVVFCCTAALLPQRASATAGTLETLRPTPCVRCLSTLEEHEYGL